MVTNCSKERPGSIVNETLKNGILMLKEPSKDIQVSSNLVFVIKSYEPEKICLILENRGKTPPKSHRIVTQITPSYSAYGRTL